MHGLDADRDRHRRDADRPVGHDPGRQRCDHQADTYTLARPVARPATRPATGAASAVPGTGADITITVALGESATCTINNNDNAPGLNLRKTVTNDNGGTALHHGLDADRDRHRRDADRPDGHDPGRQRCDLKADTYTLARPGPSGLHRRRLVLRRRYPGTGADIDDHRRAGRERHLHDQQQRQGAGSEPGQDGHQRQRRHGPASRPGRWPRPAPARRRPPVGHDPGRQRCDLQGRHLHPRETGARPATRPAPGAASADPGTGRINRSPSALGEAPPAPSTTTTRRRASPCVKTVTNDNGGTALMTAWTLTATGTGATPTNLSGTTPVDSGATFKADTYTLAETGGPSGYTAGDWSSSAVPKAPAPTSTRSPSGWARAPPARSTTTTMRRN